MEYQYTYTIKAKLEHKSKTLEALNKALTDSGAGFTLKRATDEPIELMNFALTVAGDNAAQEPKLPVDWQDDFIQEIEKVFERHEMFLSDVSFDLIGKIMLEGEEE